MGQDAACGALADIEALPPECEPNEPAASGGVLLP